VQYTSLNNLNKKKKNSKAACLFAVRLVPGRHLVSPSTPITLCTPRPGHRRRLRRGRDQGKNLSGAGDR